MGPRLLTHAEALGRQFLVSLPSALFVGFQQTHEDPCTVYAGLCACSTAPSLSLTPYRPSHNFRTALEPRTTSQMLPNVGTCSVTTTALNDPDISEQALQIMLVSDGISHWHPKKRATTNAFQTHDYNCRPFSCG